MDDDSILQRLTDKYGKRKGRKIYSRYLDDSPSLHQSMLNFLGRSRFGGSGTRGPVRYIRDKFGNLVERTGIPRLTDKIRGSSIGRGAHYINPRRYGNTATLLGTVGVGLYGAGLINQLVKHGERGLYDYDPNMYDWLEPISSGVVGAVDLSGLDYLFLDGKDIGTETQRYYKIQEERRKQAIANARNEFENNDEVITEQKPTLKPIPKDAINLYKRMTTDEWQNKYWNDQSYWKKLDSLIQKYDGTNFEDIQQYYVN